jgi:hypothetical protein
VRQSIPSLSTGFWWSPATFGSPWPIAAPLQLLPPCYMGFSFMCLSMCPLLFLDSGPTLIQYKLILPELYTRKDTISKYYPSLGFWVDMTLGEPYPIPNTCCQGAWGPADKIERNQPYWYGLRSNLELTCRTRGVDQR